MKDLHVKIQDELVQSIYQAEQGEITFLDALIDLEANRKLLEDSLAIIKQFKDENLQNISDLADQHKDGYRGYTFEVRSGGTMYNYKHIPEWITYNKALKDCEARHKQAYLAAQKGLLTATADGEEIEMPAISYRKSSLIIKPKK